MTSATTKAAQSSRPRDDLVAAASDDVRSASAAEVVQLVGLVLVAADGFRSRALRAPAAFRQSEAEREVL